MLKITISLIGLGSIEACTCTNSDSCCISADSYSEANKKLAFASSGYDDDYEITIN